LLLSTATLVTAITGYGRQGLLAFAVMAGLGLWAGPALSQSVWTPVTTDYNLGTNWTPNGVPTGTAIFDTNTVVDLNVTASTSLLGWTFNTGAGAYTFDNQFTLEFTGAGIAVNAGSATIINKAGADTYFFANSKAGSATITNDDTLYFEDTSTAGSATITNNARLRFYDTSTGGSATITNELGGTIDFKSTSSAGSATINNELGGTINFDTSSNAGSANITNNLGGTVTFAGTSNAGSATIINNNILDFDGDSKAGSATIINAAQLRFRTNGSADNATITNNNLLGFRDTSTAGSATITNNATLQFNETSTGGQAQFITNAMAVTDFSGSTGPLGDGRLTAGSLAGAGDYFLGANELTVGGNNLSTEVSGVLL